MGFDNFLSLSPFKKPSFSDIAIKLNTKNLYHLHKLILCSQSDYFASLLMDGWVDNHTSELTLNSDDVLSAESFEIILRYMYTSVIPVEKDQIFRAFVAGTYLLMPRLIEELLASILKSMTKATVLETLSLGCRCCNNELVKECVTFISLYFDEILRAPGNMQILLSLPTKPLYLILSSDTIYAKDEFQIYRFLVKRLQKDKCLQRRYLERETSEESTQNSDRICSAQTPSKTPSRDAHVDDIRLLDCIDLECMSMEEIKIIKRDRIFSTSRILDFMFKKLSDNTSQDSTYITPNSSPQFTIFPNDVITEKEEEHIDNQFLHTEESSVAVVTQVPRAQYKFSCSISYYWDVQATMQCGDRMADDTQPHYIRSDMMEDSRGRIYTCVIYPFGTKDENTMSVYIYGHPNRVTRHNRFTNCNGSKNYSWLSKFRVSVFVAGTDCEGYGIESVQHLFCNETNNWGWSEYLTLRKAKELNLIDSSTNKMRFRISIVSCDYNTP